MYGLHLHMCCFLVGGFWWVVFCLNISDNFTIACILLSPMADNGYVGSELEIPYIRSSAALVSEYLLDITSVLMCSSKKSTVFAICSSRVLFI